MSEPDFRTSVKRKADRMAAARRRGDSFWTALVHVGALGWVFVLPVVAGAVAGRSLARAVGQPALAVAPLALGIALGAYLVWWQLRRTVVDDADQDPAPSEPRPPGEGGGS